MLGATDKDGIIAKSAGTKPKREKTRLAKDKPFRYLQSAIYHPIAPKWGQTIWMRL
jgi:hypothetical protein